jgi:hypothetical protein
MPYVAMNCWGPWQRIARTLVLNAYNPLATPTTYNLSVAAYVPVGTVAVGGFGYLISSAADDGCGIRETGSSDSVAAQYTQVANIRNWFSFEVQLDASGTFDVYASHLNISNITLYLTKIAMG